MRAIAKQKGSGKGTDEEEWLDVDREEPIDHLARTLSPTLGTDDFFELY